MLLNFCKIINFQVVDWEIDWILITDEAKSYGLSTLWEVGVHNCFDLWFRSSWFTLVFHVAFHWGGTSFGLVPSVRKVSVKIDTIFLATTLQIPLVFDKRVENTIIYELILKRQVGVIVQYRYNFDDFCA